MNAMPPCRSCDEVHEMCHKQCKKYYEWSYKTHHAKAKTESKLYLYRAIKAEERANRLLKELEALNVQ